MRRKIILDYCLPIEYLDALYRSVKSLDTYKKKRKKERKSFQFNYVVSIPKPQMFRIFPESSFIITL